ncbi:hypothetical protein AYO20_06545 [Fonsecaea nubica]|uniref:Uncharacterized protein n=1 Tax=Fonsecaea nubica TaxID=856822 RepID=A0A178CW43_9EURO|nr:hypothetical protein AYO20_06545 [Fonsecaea nubica]OAL34090.1 hypothetical protein AYO20_06545 [Fonsecaea nubica]
MSASHPHDPLSFSGSQDENQTADSSPTLLSTKNVTYFFDPPRSSSECGQKQSSCAVSLVTDFLTSSSSSPTYSWLHLKLSLAERDELNKCVPAEKFEGFRRDYFVATQTFSVGMETKTHAVVNAALSFAILSRIKSLANKHPDTAIGQFAAKIMAQGSGDIDLEELGTKNSHNLDGSFVYKGAKYPGIVIEVAHSQPKDALQHLAEEYVLGSDGNVHYVCGIKAAYRSGKEAWLSAWKAKRTVLADGTVELSVEQTVKDQMFRTAEGLPDPNCRGLCLPLVHLAPTSSIALDIASVPDHLGQIRITAEELCQILDEARESEEDAIKGLV